MSPITLLVALLALAYVGSVLFGGRSIRGYGLPSGSEYVLLGFLLGPTLLGVVDRPTLGAFNPIADVGLAWLSLVIGVDYGWVGERRVPLRRLLAGQMLSLFSGTGVAVAFGAFAVSFTALSGRELLVACIGVGAVSCETARHAVNWVVERHGAKGPLSELLADVADADDIVALLAITVAFALVPSPSLRVTLPFWAFSGLTLGAGVLLGMLASALLRVEDRPTERWGIVLGATLLGIGTASRLGKSALGLCFALGLTMAVLSGRRRELRSMLSATEHPVLLPVLVLAGAHVDLAAAPWLPQLLVVVIGARLATKWLSGVLLRLAPAARGSVPWLGLGLTPSGALTMAFGLACALNLPDRIGKLVLVVAAAVTLFGELLGPTALRVALRRAGEIEAPSSRSPSSRPPPASPPSSRPPPLAEEPPLR